MARKFPQFIPRRAATLPDRAAILPLRAANFISRVATVGLSSAAAALLLCAAGANAYAPPAAAAMWPATPGVAAQMGAASKAPSLSTGLLPAEQIEKLLPPSVYFQGQSAPLQLRNAAAFRDPAHGVVWAGLVDNSGYSTGVRERYQFYFVTESALTIAGQRLPAGAYGGGFLSDGTLLIMDLGGHDLLKGKVDSDAALKRPRPLQMTSSDNALRLYVGRQYVTIVLG